MEQAGAIECLSAMSIQRAEKADLSRRPIRLYCNATDSETLNNVVQSVKDSSAMPERAH